MRCLCILFVSVYCFILHMYQLVRVSVVIRSLIYKQVYKLANKQRLRSCDAQH